MNIPIENYEKAKGNIAKKKTEILENVSNCLSKRLEEESDSETMFQHTAKILNCKGWADRGSSNIEFLDESICFFFERFQTQLKYAGMEVSYPEFISQWHNMLEYALKYIKLSGVSYLVTWKKLFTSPKKNEWSDALLLVELLFSIRVSNTKLERMFSKLKRIKTIFRASLSSTRVENLLRIVEDGLLLVEYNMISAAEAWAAEKYRHPNQQPRKTYKKKSWEVEQLKMSRMIPPAGFLIQMMTYLESIKKTLTSQLSVTLHLKMKELFICIQEFRKKLFKIFLCDVYNMYIYTFCYVC